MSNGDLLAVSFDQEFDGSVNGSHGTIDDDALNSESAVTEPIYLHHGLVGRAEVRRSRTQAFDHEETDGGEKQRGEGEDASVVGGPGGEHHGTATNTDLRLTQFVPVGR